MTDTIVELRLRDTVNNTEVVFQSSSFADVMIRSYDLTWYDLSKGFPDDLEWVFRVKQGKSSLAFSRNELAQLIGYTS